MERHTMFMDWNSRYSWNAKCPQSVLWSPYRWQSRFQYIFLKKNKVDLKFYMNAKNLERPKKEKKSKRNKKIHWFQNSRPDFKTHCSVQSLSRVRLFAIPWTAARQASLSITNLQSPPKLTSIESVNAIRPSHPLSSPSPPAPNPSQHEGLFQWVNSLHEVAKVLEFQLQHQSFQWTPRTDLL